MDLKVSGFEKDREGSLIRSQLKGSSTPRPPAATLTPGAMALYKVPTAAGWRSAHASA